MTRALIGFRWLLCVGYERVYAKCQKRNRTKLKLRKAFKKTYKQMSKNSYPKETILLNTVLPKLSLTFERIRKNINAKISCGLVVKIDSSQSRGCVRILTLNTGWM